LRRIAEPFQRGRARMIEDIFNAVAFFAVWHVL
jgi:hypothetical protein